MNTLGIALVWCTVQVTLIGLFVTGLYLLVRRLRPSAAAAVVLTGLAIVIVLSLSMMSPWPRWTTRSPAQSPVELDTPPLRAGVEGWSGGEQEVRWLDNFSLLHAPDGQAVRAAGDDDPSIKNQLSGAAMFFQALIDDLTKPQVTAPTGDWQWSGVMAVLLLAAMACGLGWLMLGVVAVRWQRLRSRPVLNASLLELADLLRAELGCSRRVELRQSGDLATAAMIGWRRLVLLLPADWTTWTAEQRRAVLAHEIAHARSNDYIALLVAHLGLALHFYHPLLHWLIGRLRLEQELAADAVAASVSGGRQQYLTTIAELALRQQDRPLLWPAHTFFFSQTTFLRRIAMLRDSRLRFDRLSPVARLITVGAVLLCGFLIAGLRGPSVSLAALGAESEKLAVPTDSIDNTYLIEKSSAIVVMRPAAVFSRPELAALAKLLEASGNVVPKGTHLSEFRQIGCIMPEADIPSGPREIVVWQRIKPIAKEDLAKRLADTKFTVKELHGKKLYVPSGGGRCVMACDDYTVVEAGSEQAMGVYLAGKPGVLPKWLPAKAWESFRSDHFVIAADTAMMRREMKPNLEYSSPVVRTALLPITSSLADATWLAAGARLDDKLAVHAWATAKNADASVSLRRMAEALKTLAESIVKGFRTPNESGHPSDRKVATVFLDLAGGLLDNMKFQQEGNDVQLQASVELGKTRLEALMTTIIASMRQRDVHTENGMMGLVEDFFRRNYQDITSRETIEWGPVVKTKDGDFSIRYKFRYSSRHGEPKIANQVFTFNPKGEFVSVSDAEKLPPVSPARVYEVHKKVSDFPNREDLTTPEAAYASIHRAYVAEGDAAWPRLSVPSLAAQIQGAAPKPLSAEAAKQFLSAEILEVHVWGGIHAVVIAREGSGRDSYMDMRWLTRVDGRWLNEGAGACSTLDAARREVEQSRSR